ncbi:MAG TPA: hypothetical protein VF009_06885 [Solirubrobacterales bacterium]
MPPVSGGLEAPPNNVGLGQNRAPRGRYRNARRPPRRQSARAQAIMEALEKSRGAGIAPQKPGIGPLPIGPGQGRLPAQAMAPQTPAARRPVQNPMRGARVKNAQAIEPRPARGRLGGAENAELGHQLDRRVQSGAISEVQAQQTAHERELLKLAYGKDWRGKIAMPEAGGGRSFQELRMALAGQEQDNPELQQAYQEAIQARIKAVEEARQLLKGRRRGRRGAVDPARRVSANPEVAY